MPKPRETNTHPKLWQECLPTCQTGQSSKRSLKNLKANLGTRMVIDKKELGPLTMKSITIRYREKRKDGIDKVRLGQDYIETVTLFGNKKIYLKDVNYSTG